MSRTVSETALAEPDGPRGPGTAGAGHAGRPSTVLVAGAALVAVAAATVALALTGAAAPSLLFDPGPVVRWGLPVVTLVGRLATAVTIGVLVLTAVAFPVTPPAGPGGRALAFAPGLRIAGGAAAGWTLATVVQAVLQYSQTSGTVLTDPQFGSQLWAYLHDTDPGGGLLVTGVVACLVTMLAAGGSTIGTVGFTTLVALVGLVPPALAGHAAGWSDHETAVTALGLHLLGTCVWVGGLTGLLVLHRRLDAAGRLSPAAAVYSTLALWSFVAVGGSGVINAWLRLPDVASLTSGYGVLVLVKSVAFMVLGTAGVLHRRRALPQLAAGAPGAFARLAGVELVVMAVAIGLATALAAGSPPSTGLRRVPTMAQSVTGYPLPPPLTPIRWLTSWQPDLLWLTLAALGLGSYLVGVQRLHHRGDRWPVMRTITWVVGMLGLVYVTSGAPIVYGRVLFSAHMLGHMSLSMVVPIFMVLAAPVTLALRSLHPRGDGSRGAREWILAMVESRYARLLSFPPVAAFLFAGSLVFFYFSPLFELALRTHVGHELMHVHFLFAGYLFAWVLVGIDPGPRRINHALRLITLVAAMAFHSFFGVSLLSGKGVLAADYFASLGRTWGSDLLYDQRLGGSIAWGIGDVPAIVMAVIIAVQWARSDDREARRRDRAAERDGDAELVAYNAMLSRIARHDTDTGEARRDPGRP